MTTKIVNSNLTASSPMDNLTFLGSADSVLKKSLRTVPAGRKRSSRKPADVHIQNTDEPDELFSIDFSSQLRDLRIELESRRRDEERLEKEISVILSETSLDGGEQSRSFGLAVSRLNNSMLQVENDGKRLAASLKTISSLADTISGRVSALDVAKTRVVECLQLASDMRDLGISAEGVDDAIRSEDFEIAAQHIHRFLTLDKAVFQYRDVGGKDSANSIRHSYEILTAATARLKKILETRLDDAVRKADVAEMQRFVKLFPLINEANGGLQRFGVYLNQKIDKLGEDNIKIMQAGGADDNRHNVLFADTLFLFFEGIAGLLESNQPIIENAYGADRLLDFITILQKNIDAVVGNVLAAFEERREVKSFIRSVQNTMRDRGTGGAERPDASHLDVLLSEMCTMNTHAEMYWRFVRRRIGVVGGENKKEEKDEFVIIGNEEKTYDEMDDAEKKKYDEEKRRRREEKEKKLDQLLNRSLLGTKMQEMLGSYILLEQFYMEESVQKAVGMDQKDDAQALTSSVIDDVLFIVRKCIRRAAASNSVDAVCATLNNGVALLETTFYDYLHKNVAAGYPSTGFAAEAFQTAQAAYNVIQHGKTTAESGPDAQREAFLTAMNNARKASQLLRDLRRSLHTEWSGKQRAKVESDKLEHAAAQIEEVARKVEQLSVKGVEMLFEAAFKPRIKTTCDSYRELPHELSMEDLEHYEAQDPFIESFAAIIDKMIAQHEPILQPDNYQTLLLTTCSEVARQLERIIMKCQFNRYGGLQLDREFRHISAYLSNAAGWTARERCARLAQIVALLNVETLEEAVELWQHKKSSSAHAGISGASSQRALSSSEAKRVLALRVDLPSQLVKNLEL